MDSNTESISRQETQPYIENMVSSPGNKYTLYTNNAATIDDINYINMKIEDIHGDIDHTNESIERLDNVVQLVATNALNANKDLNDRVTCVNKAMTDLILRNRKMEKELFILRILSIASYILVLALIIASMM